MSPIWPTHQRMHAMLSALICPSKVQNDNPHPLAYRNVGNGRPLSLGLQERIPLPIKANQNAQLGINHAFLCLLHLCYSWYIYTSTPRSQMHCRLYGLSLSPLFASQYYNDTNDNSFSMQVMSDVHRLFPDCGFLHPNIFYFTIHVRVQRLVNIFLNYMNHAYGLYLIDIYRCMLRWY
jgi:hypothetical protein